MRRWIIGLVALTAVAPVFGRGVLCLTFDDADYRGWTRAIPLFARSGAHATFFACGSLDEGALASLKRLQEAGHSVGLHTVGHVDAPPFFSNSCATAYLNEQIRPQLDACAKAGLSPRFFAYPNNRHTPETDAFLSATFTRFRAGAPLGWRDGYYSPHRTRGLAERDEAFFPVADLPRHRVMEGVGVGEYYHTDLEDICRGIRRAAARDEVLVIFSHAIAPDAKGVSMKTAWLETILETAVANGVALKGFGDLGPVAPQVPTEPLELVLTFDDGIRQHLTVAADELEKRGWRGVFCLVTGWIGSDPRKLNWDEVRALVRRGHVLAAHTVTHPSLGDCCRRGEQDRVRREIRESCDVLERETGVRPKLLCLPGTNCHPDVVRLAREEGLVTMTVPRTCFGSWGTSARGAIRRLRGQGVTRADFLVHGVSPEGGGWKPFPSVAKFSEYLDEVKAAERAGEVRIGLAGYPN